MSPHDSIQKFDYDSLDTEDSMFLQQQTSEIRGLMRRTAEDIFNIGQKLINVKEKLGHGKFGTWLSIEFGWTERTAQQFMNVARQFKSENFSDLQLAPSALYLLSAPSTSVKARQEAIKRATEGEFITHKTAKEIKKKHITETPSSFSISEPSRSRQLEIREIHAKESLSEAVSIQPTVSPTVEVASSLSVEAETWQQIGSHKLFCGEPNSRQFLKSLPTEIALSIAFAPTPNWHLNFPCLPQSNITLFSKHQDLDLKTFEEMIRLSLLLYSESQDVVVIAFLPYPSLLFVADELGCLCWIAEPNLERCQEVMRLWYQYKGAGEV